MLKIRLARVGAKKQPKYRIIAVDAQKKRNGRFIETLGHYNPMTEPPQIDFKKERVLHWIGVGAKPTKAASDLFKRYERTSRASS